MQKHLQEAEKLRLIRGADREEEESRLQLSLWERYNDRVMTACKEAAVAVPEEKVESGRRKVHSVRVRRKAMKEAYEERLAKMRLKYLDPEAVREELGG